MNLTPKQKAFADFYIETGNASEAARKAGYSLKTAGAIGNENLQKPEIIEYINIRMAELESKRAMTADEVMLFYSAVVRGEVKDISASDAKVKTLVIPTNEELMIALDTERLLSK